MFQLSGVHYTGLLSNQAEKSINFYFIRVPLRKKVLKYGTPKPSIRVPVRGSWKCAFKASGFCRGLGSVQGCFQGSFGV